MTLIRRYGVLAAGIVLVVAGAIAWWSAPSVTGFGWTAYAPLSRASFAPDVGGLQRAIGAWLAALGGMLIAAWIGFRIGRRR